MKRTTLILMLVLSSNMLIAQVDMYDITTHENVNVKKNINQNIHVGGAIYENKTITTIDYGALASGLMARMELMMQSSEAVTAAMTDPAQVEQYNKTMELM